MGMVDIGLYEFLKTHECHLYRKKNGIEAWVVVHFRDIEDFIKAVGYRRFEEEGVEVTLKDGYIAVDLDTFIDGTGTELADYKNCFEPYEWKEYFPES